jgi:hypothetical protein
LSKKQQKEPNLGPFACPSSVSWLKEMPQTDFYIKSNIMTVLAMDGRRRVMDIEKYVSAQATSYMFLVLGVSGGEIKLWFDKLVFEQRSGLLNSANPVNTIPCD